MRLPIQSIHCFLDFLLSSAFTQISFLEFCQFPSSSNVQTISIAIIPIMLFWTFIISLIFGFLIFFFLDFLAVLRQKSISTAIIYLLCVYVFSRYLHHIAWNFVKKIGFIYNIWFSIPITYLPSLHLFSSQFHNSFFHPIPKLFWFYYSKWWKNLYSTRVVTVWHLFRSLVYRFQKYIRIVWYIPVNWYKKLPLKESINNIAYAW